jgi:hypothetical protein
MKSTFKSGLGEYSRISMQTALEFSNHFPRLGVVVERLHVLGFQLNHLHYLKTAVMEGNIQSTTTRK